MLSLFQEGIAVIGEICGCSLCIAQFIDGPCAELYGCWAEDHSLLGSTLRPSSVAIRRAEAEAERFVVSTTR